MLVKGVHGHLHRVKSKAMLVGGLDHVQMHLRSLVAGKTDETNFAFLARLLQHVDHVPCLECLLRIGQGRITS